jgi:hypothetical protein
VVALEGSKLLLVIVFVYHFMQALVADLLVHLSFL